MSGERYGTPPARAGTVVQSLGPAPVRAAPAAMAAWSGGLPAYENYPRTRGESAAYAPAYPQPKIPSLARRLTVGALRLVPLLFLYVVLPEWASQPLEANHVALGVPLGTLVLFGAALAILSTAAYVLKPTRAFGPLSVVSSLGGVLYLVYFAGLATVSISLSNVGIQLGFGNLLLLLAIVPAIGLVSGVLTTIEDARHPGERLPFDYPA